MKLFTLILFVGMLQVSTAAVGQKINLSEQNAPLAKVFKKISQQSGYGFMVEGSLLKTARPVTILAKDADLEKVLLEIFESQPLTFTINEQSVIVSAKKIPFFTRNNAFSVTARQQLGRISGKVVDDRGEALPGASIKILQTDQAVQSSIDGTYSFSTKPGSYTIEVSYISFQTKRITEIEVKSGQTTGLNIVLKPATNALSQVTVTGNYKKESVAGLYAQQKNAAGLSDGISAEQIGRTPDSHVGESLARITGVSTTEGKRVVVRGIAERYNVATLNGSSLPSTDVQERNFEFDLIPTNLVDNIVVSKSITPDMPYGFAGGLVKITTKSVPVENFTSFEFGVGFNDRTIGEDFLGYGRGKYDYLGYDDGKRDHFPEGLLMLRGKFDPNKSTGNTISAAQVADQNALIGGTERLGTRVFQAVPTQNYQLSLGRVFSLDQKKVRKLGFVGSLSYRNTQRNNYIANMRRGDWSIRPTNADDPEDVNTGNRFAFNTTLGGLLNGGFNTEKHALETYNLYTRIYDSQFNRISGWSWDNPKSNGNQYPYIQEDDRPKFTTLLQNKIVGKHDLGRFTIDWSAARTALDQVEQDAVQAQLISSFYDNLPNLQYYNFPNQSTDPNWGPINRGRFAYKEVSHEGLFNAAYRLKLGNTSHIIKAGYNYMYRHLDYSWLVLPIVLSPYSSVNYREIPIQEWGNHMGMADPNNSLFYQPDEFSNSAFEAKSATNGTYAMVDSKIGDQLRLVWGGRAEHFKLDTLKNPASLQADRNTLLLMDEDKKWLFLPSANLTYSPFSSINVRASYAKSAIRPGLMENARFSRYSPEYGSRVRSQGVISTLINNYDAKLEWFPSAGEIISVGYFHKYFDKPAEFYRLDNLTGSGSSYVTIGNSESARVQGWEFELRKKLSFIRSEWTFLEDIYLSGNLTLQKSKVKARELIYGTDEQGNETTSFSYLKYPRQLYGQVPLLLNLGLQYSGSRLGLNVSYNYMDYKTFVTSSRPDLAEYERPRGQLDAQVSYQLLRKRMDIKLNMSNLTDAPHRFFVNDSFTYEQKEGTEGMLELEWADRYQYKTGFSEKFEKGYTDPESGRLIGDRETFTRYVGRTFSLSISYKF